MTSHSPKSRNVIHRNPGNRNPVFRPLKKTEAIKYLLLPFQGEKKMENQIFSLT